jgi:hypothetical protein
VVITRQPDENNRLSYPAIFEPTPGRLWISTAQGGARLAINEADFLGDFDYVFQMPQVPEVTGQLASENFLYRYEFDVNPTNPAEIDLDGNGQADWATGGTGTFTLTPQGTVVINSGPDSVAYYESGIASTSHLWPNVGFTTEEGFTIEWRMRVLSDTGTGAAFALVADAADNDELPVLEVADDHQTLSGAWCSSPFGETDNTDGFHTFRLVRDAADNSNRLWFWRDDVLLTPSGLYPAREYVRNAVYFGDIGGAYDGVVEVDYFRLTPGAFAPVVVPGDANSDGVVNDKDASILASHWLQPSGAAWADGDFNNDGKVNDRDAAIMAAHWTAGDGGETSVPEPGTLALLIGAMLGLFSLRHVRRDRRGNN